MAQTNPRCACMQQSLSEIYCSKRSACFRSGLSWRQV